MLNSVKNAELENKTVFLRVDYNVPVENGFVKDDTRIKRSLATIKYLLNHNCRIIAVSHLGRPQGKIVPTLSLQPVAGRLMSLLGINVSFIPDLDFELIKERIELDKYQIILLENTRFFDGEVQNDEGLSKNFAKLADIFVSDAFGAVHRAHASTVGVSKHLPSFAGLLVENEYTRIISSLNEPNPPSLAIVGGAKVSTKMDILKKFIDSVDNILIGGAMAFTFLKAQGYEIGKSLYEQNLIDSAKSILESADLQGVGIYLPLDFRVGKSYDEPILDGKVAKIIAFDKLLPTHMGLDIGPLTEEKFKEEINKANSILWNGPMGVFENNLYQNGSKVIASAIVDRDVDTIIGGGETIYALNLVGPITYSEKIHVSTGGGATLELLSGLILPGIECLKLKDN